jgi:hypothetical protein
MYAFVSSEDVCQGTTGRPPLTFCEYVMGTIPDVRYFLMNHWLIIVRTRAPFGPMSKQYQTYAPIVPDVRCFLEELVAPLAFLAYKYHPPPPL